jgi:hypothetical protein
MPPTTARLVLFTALISLGVSSCASTGDTATTASGTGQLVPLEAGSASGQLSLADAPAAATPIGPADDTDGADTSSGEEAEDDATEAESESPLATPLELGCSTTPAGRFRVEVLLDDADGGLHLRTGPGTSNDIILALPTGTEVAAAGGCEVSDNGREWYELTAVTDPAVRGWAAADWLIPWRVSPCPAGAADVSGLVDVTTTVGDFDGDGQPDTLTLGNHEEGDTAVAQFEFADGGFAGGPIDMERVGEVLTSFRPIGAAHELVLARNVWQSGASTVSWTAIAVDDCTVQIADAIFEGIVVESSVAGSCLEATPLGDRLWTWFESLATDEEPEPVRNWTAQLWHDGAFVETPALEFGTRTCTHPADQDTE